MITTRDEICKQAFKLFCENGYGNVSVDSICQKCGVTRGSFYHHFKSKDDLLLSWFEDYMNSSNSFLIDNYDGSAKEKLWMCCENYAGFLASLGRDLLYHIMMADFSANGEYFTPATMNNSKYTFLRDAHLSLIRESQIEGSISALLSAEKLLFSYVCAVTGLIVNWKLTEGNFDFKEQVRILYNTIFR